MLGILVILIVSWSLLYFLVKKNLRVLGVTPIGKRILQFAIGFLFFGTLNFLFIYLDSAIKSGVWVANPGFKLLLVFESLWYHFKSALTEDLIFRGVLLYILILKIGAKRALLISAFAFGVYHWFSYGVFGNGLVLMTAILLVTGSIGYVWAYSFNRTKSVVMGLGMHLGWNFVATLFTVTTPYGGILYTVTKLDTFDNEWFALVYYLLKEIAPAVMAYFFIRFLTRHETKIAD